jgi:hypothetical protein
MIINPVIVMEVGAVPVSDKELEPDESRIRFDKSSR